MMRSPTPESASNQEYALLQHVERLDRYREGRKAVCIHLSRLRSYHKVDYQMRIAINTFENSIGHLSGQLFKLPNYDLFFFYQNISPEDVDDALSRLARLFDDDPLTRNLDRSTDQGLYSWFDLERQYNELRTIAQGIYEEARKRLKRLAALAGPGQGEAKTGKLPISPNRLGELVDTISKADLSGLMRRQTICALLRDQPPQSLFRELFISVQELRDLILPNYNITANRWLFQYLTETLDKRMLALLSRNDDPDINASFSINLNISTLLSPEFLAFDASLRQSARGSILIELQIIDIYADLSAFFFARDFLQGRGYRLCLDGLTDRTIHYIDRHQLGIDFIKLQWSPSMAADSTPESRAKLQAVVEKAGKVSTILCHVDSEDAIAFGRALGIAMFQGRHVEQLLQASRRPGLRA